MTLATAGKEPFQFMDKFTEFFWIVRLSQYCDRAILVIPDTTIDVADFHGQKLTDHRSKTPVLEWRQSFWPFSCSYLLSLWQELYFIISLLAKRKMEMHGYHSFKKAISSSNKPKEIATEKISRDTSIWLMAGICWKKPKSRGSDWTDFVTEEGFTPSRPFQIWSV